MAESLTVIMTDDTERHYNDKCYTYVTNRGDLVINEECSSGNKTVATIAVGFWKEAYKGRRMGHKNAN